MTIFVSNLTKNVKKEQKMGIKKGIFSDGNKKERTYMPDTKLQSCHSFAMTSINSSHLKATWYKNERNYIIELESSTLWHEICL